MAKLFTPRQIAEFVLRRVRLYTAHDDGVDPAYLSIALEAMDMALAEFAGTYPCHWLVENTISVDLAADTVPQNVVGLSASIGDTSLQYITDVQIRRTATGDQSSLTRLSRSQYNEIPDKTASGPPTHVYIDRQRFTPDFYFYPVPATADFDALVTWQKVSPDLTENTGAEAHGLEAAFQRWMTYRAASDIGDGPAVALPLDYLSWMEKKAEQAEDRLKGFTMRENKRERFVKYRGF